MKILYKKLLKPILFIFHPDDVHVWFLQIGKLLGSNFFTKALVEGLFKYENPVLEQKVCGINFSNPVGLSAGFDKDGDLTNIIERVGFGFESVGTLTPQAYEGNPKPWTQRLINSKSILVNFGLKNKGSEEFIKTHSDLNSKFPYFISVGKTNCPDTVTLEQGINDYKNILTQLEQVNLGSVYEINISCPNAYGGESFASPKSLDLLLEALQPLKLSKPVFLKMPINLPWEEFREMLAIAVKYNVSGVIIGNLNKIRDESLLIDPLTPDMKGNLSGKPTQKLSNDLIAKTYKEFGNKLVIVGVGGIFSVEDAIEKIRLGASLIELITGMIFEGPMLIGEINRGLTQHLTDKGLNNISELVGEAHRI